MSLMPSALRPSIGPFLVTALFALVTERGLQAQDFVSRSFAPLELRSFEAIEMVAIPAGAFVMGSQKNIDEKPPHTVNHAGFLIGKTEVTQRQWQDVMGGNPSSFKSCGPDCPVENVSWNDVQEFIAKLSRQTGQVYRLPTEAEWEYAARSGGTAEWGFGSDESKLDNYAWYSGKTGIHQTQAVGQKLPNEFGLFDMHGNVWEWTQDCWHENYVGAPTNGIAWATGCTSDSRVVRGGAWYNGSYALRSAYRFANYPDQRSRYTGFRIARDLPPAPATGVSTRMPDAEPIALHERTVYFDFDSFVIGAEARMIIEAHARRLRNDPKLRVALEGHADRRAVREYSLGLGQKRADAVRKALSLLGVADSQMEAVSFGQEKPASAGNSEAAMKDNRRVEINYR